MAAGPHRPHGGPTADEARAARQPRAHAASTHLPVRRLQVVHGQLVLLVRAREACREATSRNDERRATFRRWQVGALVHAREACGHRDGRFQAGGKAAFKAGGSN